MQVKEFPNDSWWEEDYYHLDLDCRAMIDSLGHPMHNSWTNPDQFDQAALADFFEHFNGCRKYFTASYSDYGGDIFDRLFCEAVKKLHEKPEKELTVRQQLIREKSCVFPSGYGGETCYIWCQFGVPQFEKFSTDFYQRGLDYVEELFGDWEDALCMLEQKMYDKAWDFLVESYPALKGEDELEEKIRSWLEAYGHVMPTFVDYSENRLMKEVGAFVLDNHTPLSTDGNPLPFHWLKGEWNKAMKDADELPDAESQVKMHKQIDGAYDKALEQLGYAFAKGEAAEWLDENKDFGWLPWNKSEE